MFPAPFEYHRANSLEEALELLARFEGDAKLLAGGHSLIPTMKLRLNTPAHVIDIRNIPGFAEIRRSGDQLVIGGGTPHAAIEKSAEVQRSASALAQAAAVIGDPQVRNMGTIGGSLAHADPAADYPAAVLAYDAQIVAVSAEGERIIPAGEFFVDLFTTALEEGEIIKEIRFPVDGDTVRSAYLKFPHPASRFAVVGCAVRLTMDGNTCTDARVAFTGVAATAFRDEGVEQALIGKTLDDAAVKAAAQQAAENDELEFMEDHFASEAYRKHLAKVYAERAICTALGR